ncbi:hypothetical protein ACGFX8_11885 [Streptomyces sp. NPDC048362]|uniref:hypothetical protein n=1 Tax=Streptomyces sp. NPDC048362 TaxID=3365539 RepID=UPI00371789C9
MTILSSDPLAYPLSRPSHGGPRIRCDTWRGICRDTPDPTRSAPDAAHRATAAADGHIGIPVNNSGINAFGPARAYRSGHGHDLEAPTAGARPSEAPVPSPV